MQNQFLIFIISYKFRYNLYFRKKIIIEKFCFYIKKWILKATIIIQAPIQLRKIKLSILMILIRAMIILNNSKMNSKAMTLLLILTIIFD